MSNRQLHSACLSILILVASVFVHAATADSGEQKNFLWKVKADRGVVYLFGSIHFLRQDLYPLSSVIERSFDDSDVLVVEADISKMHPGNLQKMIDKAFYPPHDSVKNHLSGRVYQTLLEKLERYGIPLELAHNQKPWFLALTLSSLELINMGYDPAYGMDMYFLTNASGKKRIQEIESIDFQIDLLSNFSDRDQEFFLLYTLENLDSMAKEVDSLVAAWKNGDSKAMESLLASGVMQDRRMTTVLERLFDERNAHMTGRIKEYLKTGETYFVVIGAGHLIGKKGIVELLRSEGYDIKQM